MSERQKHWDQIFSKTLFDNSLGWYERHSTQTLNYLDRLDLAIPSTIFISGAGTSVLPGDLLVRGHKLIINDVSEQAVQTLRKRIGPNGRATWLSSDLALPLPESLVPIDLWIDRAVLHFLLSEEDIQQYFNTVQSAVRSGGYVLLAQFSTKAVDRCAGLGVHRYSLEEMGDRLGGKFRLIEDEIHNYTAPGGASRPYLYALYQKRNID